MNPPFERRVVITGMGVITPNGNTLAAFWSAVRDGKSAAKTLTRFDLKDCQCRLAAEIHNWTPTDYLDAKVSKRLERSLQFGCAAARLATEDAGIDFARIDADRCGIVEATSLSNMEAAYRAQTALDARGIRAISPSMMISG